MVEIVFVLFALLVSAVVMYPFRQMKLLSLLLGLGIFCLLFLGEFQLGQGKAWLAYYQEKAKLEQAKSILNSFKNTEEVIQALKARLDNTPKSAHGWFLLGRLYASASRWKLASQAFAKAHQLAPSAADYFTQFAISLWQAHHQQMTPKIREMFQQILVGQSDSAEALMFLAMDAQKRHDNQLAIRYWTRLLALVPPGSEEARKIKEAILKARP